MLDNIKIYKGRGFSIEEIRQDYQEPFAMFVNPFTPMATGFLGFKSSGTSISPVLSMGGNTVNWASFSNTFATPDDSTVTVEIRTTDDGITWSSYGAVGSASDSIFSQIKLTLNANTGATETPAVDLVKLLAKINSAILHFYYEGIKYIDVSSAHTVILVPEKETLIRVDTDGGAVTITLPALINLVGKVYNIKNVGTSGNDVTVTPNGSETIENEANQTISDSENMKIMPGSATDWSIL
jgi:hypothetical protein